MDKTIALQPSSALATGSKKDAKETPKAGHSSPRKQAQQTQRPPSQVSEQPSTGISDTNSNSKRRSSSINSLHTKISALAADIILDLDVLKVQSAGLKSLDDGGPVLISIKSVVEDIEKLKKLLPVTIKTDRSQLAALPEDRLARMHLLIRVLGTEIQVTLQELKSHVSELPEQSLESIVEILRKIKSLFDKDL